MKMKGLIYIISVAIVLSIVGCRKSKEQQPSADIPVPIVSEVLYSFDPYNKGLTLLLLAHEDILTNIDTIKRKDRIIYQHEYNIFYPYLLKFLNRERHNYTFEDTLKYSYRNDTIISINRQTGGPEMGYLWSRSDLFLIHGGDIIRDGTLSYSFDKECIEMLEKWDIDNFMKTYNPDNNLNIFSECEDYITRIVIKDGIATDVNTLQVHAARYKK